MSILPCPFCGNPDPMSDTAIFNGLKRGMVQCLKEECWAFMYGKTESQAIKMWNRRPRTILNILPPVDEEAERIVDEHLSKRQPKLKKIYVNKKIGLSSK